MTAPPDTPLYRATHPTFEAYCRERWGMGRRNAYQLIGAAEAVENVRHGAQGPANERQVRPLLRLPAAQQGEAWANAGNCGRCGVAVADGEFCWWCHAPLCRACWEAVGHCGHLEAEDANVAGRGH